MMVPHLNRPVGKQCLNLPDDVGTVQTLLNNCRSAKVPVSKHCGPETIQAILDFQKGFLPSPDGKILPGGITWQKLLASTVPAGPIFGPFLPLTLEPIVVQSIAVGGYTIHYKGSLPPGSRLGLLVGRDTNFIDIHPHYHAAHLGHLLSLIDKQNYWGLPVDCWVAAFSQGTMMVETKSNARKLECPVAPLTSLKNIGRVAAYAELGSQIPKLNYVLDGPGNGRLIKKFADGKYYFTYGPHLETKPGNRGFDCTTFVGSGIGQHSGMGGTSEEFATAIGALDTDLDDDATLDEVRKFFKTNKTGAYIMWSEGHIVAVVDGFVHEFTCNPKDKKTWGQPGYKHTDVQIWHQADHKTTYTVRKLPQKYA